MKRRQAWKIVSRGSVRRVNTVAAAERRVSKDDNQTHRIFCGLTSDLGSFVEALEPLAGALRALGEAAIAIAVAAVEKGRLVDD